MTFISPSASSLVHWMMTASPAHKAQAFINAFLTTAKSVGGKVPRRFSNRMASSEPMPCTLATDSASSAEIEITLLEN